MTSAITLGRALRTWRVAGFVATETLHRPRLRLPLHDHEAANVTIVLRGGFDERVERRSVAAQRSSVIVKPAGARHANAYGSAEVACITIEVPPSIAVAEARHIQSPMLALLAERLRDEVPGRDAASDLCAEELIREIAAIVQRRARVRDDAAAWLAVVEEMLRDDRRCPSLSALAAAVGRHPAHVAREFRARYGCSVGAFARARRVDRARDALLATDRGIAEIALDAGFYDQSHFTNVFRRLLGTTPERYRARRRR